MKIKNFKKILGRNFLIILILLLQAAFVAVCFFKLYEYSNYIYGAQTILSFLLVCYVINKKETNPAYKLSWSLLIMLIPIFGAFMYIFFHSQLGTMFFRESKNQMIKVTSPLIPQDEEVINELKNDSMCTAHMAKYVKDYGGYPVYKNTQVEYYSIGEEKYASMIEELEKAKHFIFLEYFIINNGKMWDTILKILERKAEEGVEVRLLYDGMLNQFQLPDYYNKYIETKGIQCRVFNAFRPFLSTVQNNRDHRKILVIDGVTAFNGGINLADEYINEKERFGHWKDTAVMIKGEAVWSFTMMFLQMWEWKSKQISDFGKYKADASAFADLPESPGFVMPYGDTPTNNEEVGKFVYMNIINNAKKYVYITTPYLIIDNELITALGYAAKSGVDIKIIVPHIADKWYVNILGWNYYEELIRLGVKIYEYMPGFIHAKNFVSDDTTAVVGTINMDYRSLYLHFECATMMYKTTSVSEIKTDFLDTLARCRQITLEDCKKRPLIKRLAGGLLRIIAPLL
ncbi:cardiolipin synthase [Porcipelethomonas sp.]|uniref:cardiolipin synthase n=1 Tax=Porcipelethomonas sp. TaxID=2981675 RepID=UPI003EFAED7C